MDQYSNISLMATPSEVSHVLNLWFADARYARIAHTHTISDITGLTDELATFVTQTDLDTTLASYVTGSELTTTLADYATTASVTSTLENYVTGSALGTVLESYATISAINSTLDSLTEAIAATYATQASLAGYSLVGHQHTVEPVDAVPNSGIITLERNKTQYVKTVTANTVIGFDATALGLGASDAATFELLIKMGTYTRQVLFGSTVRWLNGEEPLFNTPNTSYLCAFRTYDGGASWVGSYEGQF